MIENTTVPASITPTPTYAKVTCFILFSSLKRNLCSDSVKLIELPPAIMIPATFPKLYLFPEATLGRLEEAPHNLPSATPFRPLKDITDCSFIAAQCETSIMTVIHFQQLRRRT
jgi:hypothetical protein